jgi:hypothetical protein
MAEFDHQLHNGRAMHASQPGGRTERVAFYQVVQNFDLLLSGEDVGHGEPAFAFAVGSR